MEKHLRLSSESTLERICADLGAAGPSDNIVMVHGKPARSVTYLALHMAFAGLARRKPVVFLDGGNTFDPFLISKLARAASLPPADILGRIHISRAFTCHQMQALVGERLATALDRFDTNVAIVSGLLDTFYDQSVPFSEAHGLLKATATELVRLAAQGKRILLACPDTHLPLESRQRRFLKSLKERSGTVLRSEAGNGAAAFEMEKPYRKQYGQLKTPEPVRQRWR